MIISLGRRLPGASSSLPERHSGRTNPRAANAPRGRGGEVARTLIFGLAPGGVYRAGPVARVAGELLPHRFTLTAREGGGLFSVALVRGVAPPGR